MIIHSGVMNSKLIYILTLVIIFAPLAVSAQFVPMVGIPGVSAEGGVGSYINALYRLAISVAAFLAVIRLIMAGVKYMMTDVIPNKQSAKADIKNSLLGLLIVIGAALILQTINPNLRVFSVFEELDNVCDEANGSCTTPAIPTGSSGGGTGVRNANPNTGETTLFTQTCPPITSDDGSTIGFNCESSRNSCNLLGGREEIIAGNTFHCYGSQSGNTTNTSPSSSGITYRGQTIDTSVVYRVNDPGDPSLGLSVGENHNQPIQIIGVSNDLIQVREVGSGREYGIGCALILPEIPGCN